MGERKSGWVIWTAVLPLAVLMVVWAWSGFMPPLFLLGGLLLFGWVLVPVCLLQGLIAAAVLAVGWRDWRHMLWTPLLSLLWFAAWLVLLRPS